MSFPSWRIWITGLLTLGWLALAVRFFTVKNQPVLAALCLALGLMNAFFTWQAAQKNQAGHSSQAASAQDPQQDPQNSQR